MTEQEGRETRHATSGVAVIEQDATLNKKQQSGLLRSLSSTSGCSHYKRKCQFYVRFYINVDSLSILTNVRQKVPPAASAKPDTVGAAPQESERESRAKFPPSPTIGVATSGSYFSST